MLHDRGAVITATTTEKALMRLRLMLILILLFLFAAAVPTVWGQDARGHDGDEMQDGGVSEAVGDEEPEPDEGADSEAWDEPEAEAEIAIDDESGEFADEVEPSADEESDASDGNAFADMPDDEGSDTDMTESEGGDTSAEESAGWAEAGESDVRAEDAPMVASEQVEEEEEADNTVKDEDVLEADDAAADVPDVAMQPTDGGQVESAVGNRANADPQRPAGAPASPPVAAQSFSAPPPSAPAPERTPCPPVAQPTAESMTRLWVGNLPYKVTEFNLEDVFGAHGEVKSVQLGKDGGGILKGYAIVEMSTSAGAHSAIEGLNETNMMGRRINVSIYRHESAASQGGNPARSEGSGCNSGDDRQGRGRAQ